MRRLVSLRRPVLLGRLVLLVVLLGGTARAACPALGARLVVDTAVRELSLCDGGRAARSYRVALGRGGVDKRKQGDARTPLGEYALTPGRPSSKFHTFLSVGYPTAAQRQAGYTGGDVGVHGPGRGFRWMGRLSTVTNWTLGCVAVGSDAEIDEIATWVRDHAARIIEIR